MKPAYYNEIDPYAVQWLKNLIKAGHIPAGDVDDRSIVDVAPTDLRGYGQCHFFAGIGVWSHSLRLAGWPDDRPVWTGSCPCQPFSVAGKRGGFDDDRHLWPSWFELIQACNPLIIFGEQVASAGVVGRGNKGMYGLPGRQTSRSISEILGTQSRGGSPVMQGVPTGIREGLAIKHRGSSTREAEKERCEIGDLFAGISSKVQGEISGRGMQTTLFEEKPPVRSGSAHRENTRTDNGWDLRSFGHCSESGARTGAEVQFAISGSERSCGRVSLQQYPDSELRGERGYGQLGRGSGIGSDAILDSKEGLTTDQRRISGAIDGCSDAENPAWIDVVFSDLEGAGYACAAVDLPAASVGAPHIRQRLFWMADSAGPRPLPGSHSRVHSGEEIPGPRYGEPQRPSPTGGFWRAADWIWCRDGKHRPVEPGTRALAHGATARVGRLRAYGNAIVAPAAAEVIAAYMAVRP